MLGVCGCHQALASEVARIGIRNTAGETHEKAPISFGYLFKTGDLAANDSLRAVPERGGETIPMQMDVKARHADGSVRHGVLSMVVPELKRGTTRYVVNLAKEPLTAPAPSISALLQTDFDATITINTDGKSYKASARQLLASGDYRWWLKGPLVSEWQMSGPLVDQTGQQQSRLHAVFGIRFYPGSDLVRLSATIENNWTHSPKPQNVHYDVTITLRGTPVLAQESVTHYHQSRWRRTFWSRAMPPPQVLHDRRYLASTRAVPSYDPSLKIPSYTLAEMQTTIDQQADVLLSPGLAAPYMPTSGARADIAPLPRWTARYLVTQDQRAWHAMLVTAERAGSFGIHYRDRKTGLPVSIDEYPDLTIMGDRGVPDVCIGDCETPYTGDVAHQPSLSYVPYLVTGDYFHLEELQFWANWNLFYWGDHGGSKGLLYGDEVRAQAWGLRTIAHAAYITPDNDPLKRYFLEKLDNNLTWYNESYSGNSPTPLGYLLNHPDLELSTFAPWMDDFFTWTIGHIVNLGFVKATPLFQYKSRFPIGRMTNEQYCWILGSIYWTPELDGGTGRPFQSWESFRSSVITTWSDEGSGPSFGWEPQSSAPAMTNERIGALKASRCASSQMADLLGLRRGEMIGYSWDPEGQTSVIQPALAVAVELAAPGARDAWKIYSQRSVKPESENYTYNIEPHWAIVPTDLDH